MRARGLAAIAAVFLATPLLLASPLDSESPAEEAFPLLEGIRPHVEFWTRVWGEWELNQVAIHDLRYPALVYEIVDLPGPTAGSYTEEQKQFLEQLRRDWEIYLEGLTQRVADGSPLDELDQAWLSHIDSRVGRDKLAGSKDRIRTQRGLRQRFREGLERSYRFEEEIRAILRQYDLPEDLAYLPHVESSYQYHALSTAGAAGIWQFTRGTGGQFMTINSVIDERLDPIAATHGAAQYLKHALSVLDSWPLALTSYNHGVNGMLKAKSRFGTDFERIVAEYDGKLFGFASRNFYAEFLAAREIASNAGRYFPEGYAPEPPWNYESFELDRLASPKWIADHYDLTVVELAALNPAWLRKTVEQDRRLPVGSRVWLPAGSLARMASSGRSKLPAQNRPDVYVVRSGDSLSRIAARHGVTLTRLRELNDIDSGNHVIHVGDHLLIPGSGARAETHTVSAGENLTDIAQRYGLSLTELRRFNKMQPRESVIRVGQSLRLAPPEAREHVVRSGDNLSLIAGRYRVALGELLAVNALSSSAILQPGQILRIPD